MTDNDLPAQSSPPHFKTRRERREYERALAEGRPYTGSSSSTQGHTTDQASEESQQSKTTGDDHNIPLHPQPIAADGSGGLQQRPQLPQYYAQRIDVEERQYKPELNNDLGGLNPLPADQRDYPDLSTLEDEEDEDTVSADHDEKSLGYMLVADDTTAVPELDEEQLKARQARKRKRTLIMLTSFGVFLGLLAIVGIGVGQLIGWTNNDYPGPGGEEVVFEVNPGEGPIVIGNRLVEQDIVASTGAFRDALEAVNTSSEIQPGEYTLQYQMPARDAAETLLRVGVPGMNYAHVNSGHRIEDVYATLEERTDYSLEEIEAAADPANYEVPDEATTLEGYIAVGEYHFPLDASLEEIFQEMIEPTMDEFARLEVTDPAEQHRLVTIASILEAEARPDDFETVAGIIENRLDNSNPETAGYLQIDATVIYGMGVRQLQFSAEDRRDESNEYNTYEHRGLPPGPIGAPSIAALDAAAAPEDNDYYYWITTNIETGETHFSTTYEQHREYQQEYRAYCDENPSICGRD
ncbi:MAG TPA: endolytic transglycosylase MltG [Yaniella sp.]